MTDLTAWLLERIAADEAVARAASPGPWFRDGLTVRGGPEGRSIAPAHNAITENAEHIARHDPARVLAECAAKRRIVELCAQSASYIFDDDPDDPIEWSAEVHMAADTLRALASVYADAPGFSEEWL